MSDNPEVPGMELSAYRQDVSDAHGSLDAVCVYGLCLL